MAQQEWGREREKKKKVCVLGGKGGEYMKFLTYVAFKFAQGHRNL